MRRVLTISVSWLKRSPFLLWRGIKRLPYLLRDWLVSFVIFCYQSFYIAFRMLVLSMIVAYIGHNSMVFFGQDDIAFTNFYMLMEAISGIFLFYSIRLFSAEVRRNRKATRIAADIGIAGFVVEFLDEIIGHPTWMQLHEYLIMLIIMGIVGWRAAKQD